MIFLEALKEWTDLDGLVSTSFHPQTKNTTGNGLLYLSLACVLAEARGELDISFQKYFEETLRSCQIQKGLYKRSPTKTEEMESWDDYCGIASASQEFAKEICEYGETHRWNFNNINPTKFSFQSAFWRFPYLIAHIKWASGKKPNFLLRMYWSLTVSLGGLSSDPNSFLLSWLLIKTNKDPGFLESLAIEFWQHKLHKKYSGFKEVLRQYFSSQPEHPLVTYWVDL